MLTIIFFLIGEHGRFTKHFLSVFGVVKVIGTPRDQGVSISQEIPIRCEGQLRRTSGPIQN